MLTTTDPDDRDDAAEYESADEPDYGPLESWASRWLTCQTLLLVGVIVGTTFWLIIAWFVSR